MLLKFKIDIVSQHLYAGFAGKLLGQDETIWKSKFFPEFYAFQDFIVGF